LRVTESFSIRYTSSDVKARFPFTFGSPSFAEAERLPLGDASGSNAFQINSLTALLMLHSASFANALAMT